AIVGRLGKPFEPGSDGRERAHKAACAQQLAPHPPACSQNTIEPRLVDFVHVQEAVRRPLVKRAVLDILADDPGTLFIAATEKPAVVIMRWGLALTGMVVLVLHGNSLSPKPLVIRSLPEKAGHPQIPCRAANSQTGRMDTGENTLAGGAKGIRTAGPSRDQVGLTGGTGENSGLEGVV